MSSFRAQLVNSCHAAFLRVRDHLVDFVLVTNESGVHEVPVQDRRSLRGRTQQPGEEKNFHLVVEWHTEREKDVGERFEKRKQCEANPVHDPVDVFAWIFAPDRLVRAIRRIQRTDEKHDKTGDQRRNHFVTVNHTQLHMHINQIHSKRNPPFS